MAGPDIFLSYNREDAEFARQCAKAFAAEGYDVWWDVVLRSGETYDAVTESALRNARAVVVLWSPRSVNSRWVRAEATLADRSRKLVPAMIEPCERPIMFELTQTADLCGWDGNPSHAAWQSFLGDVKEVIDADGRAVGAAATGAMPPTAAPGQAIHGHSPTLAILPFTNRSGLSEDEVFAFGMVEDIVDALSQSSTIRVLSSSAVARFVSAGVPDLGAIAEQLGARYILEGNSRRFGNDLIVTAQLLNAHDGAILWSRKFDKALERLAELQEELVLQVASSLGSQVFHLELDRILHKPSSHTAWEAMMRSMALMREITDESVSRSLEEAERAVAIAPDYGPAVGMLAAFKGLMVYEVSPDDQDLVGQVRNHVKAAIELAPNHAYNLVCASEAMSFIGEPKEGLRLAERALAINNRVTEGHLARGMAYGLLGLWNDAIRDFQTEMAIWPGYYLEFSTLLALALMQIGAGRWDEAKVSVERSLEANPDDWHTCLFNAVLLSLDGHEGAAQTSFVRALKLGQIDTLERAEWYFKRLYHDASPGDRMIAEVRRLWAATRPPQ